MGTDSIFRLGDKVQIRVSKHWYSTIIESIEDNATFFVSPLLSMRSQVMLTKGQTYTVSMIKDTGLYELDALVLDTDYLGLNQNIPMIKLRMVSEPRRNQRRNSFRVGIIIDIVVRSAGEMINGSNTAGYDARTLNISEGGLLFLSRKSYPLGVSLTFDIVLNRFGMHVTLKGIKAEVVRISLTEPNSRVYQIGVAFKELSRQDRKALVKFNMMSQRENQKKAK